MSSVSYRGITVVVEHPALWMDKGDQIVRDLIDVLTHPGISLDCLNNLLQNAHRLAAGQYESPGGRGCLMFVLTEPLGSGQIRSKIDLIRFFGRERGFFGWLGYVAAKDSPEYQPAKWLVRLVDGQFCGEARSRYGRSCELFDLKLILAVTEQVLIQRKTIEAPAAKRAHYLVQH